MYPPAGGGMRDPVDTETALNFNKYIGSLSAGFLPPVEKTAFSTVSNYKICVFSLPLKLIYLP
jgi:hypothetical protein